MWQGGDVRHLVGYPPSKIYESKVNYHTTKDTDTWTEYTSTRVTLWPWPFDAPWIQQVEPMCRSHMTVQQSSTAMCCDETGKKNGQNTRHTNSSAERSTSTRVQHTYHAPGGHQWPHSKLPNTAPRQETLKVTSGAAMQCHHPKH